MQMNGDIKSPQPQEIQQGLVKNMKSSFEKGSVDSSYSSRSHSPNFGGNFQLQTEAESKQCNGAENMMMEAQRLRQEAHKQFQMTEEEFRKAHHMQEEASRQSEQANMITIQALNKEVEGQEKLVQAGHKLMEAGAKLQAEAACIGRDRHAVINTHNMGQLRQKVQVEAPVVPPPSELHVLQTRTATQCIPVTVQEQTTYEAQYQNGPQTSF